MKYGLKIIEMRCRPPYGNFLHDGAPFGLYDTFWAERFSKMNDMPVEEYLIKRDLNMFIETMDESGIDIGVVPLRSVTGSPDSDVTDLMDMYPGRFLGVTGIDPNNGIYNAYQKIEKLVKEGPFSGVIMEPTLDSTPWNPCDEKLVYPIYEKLQAENIPCLLTFGGMFGVPEEHMSGLLQAALDFPKLNFVVCHGAFPEAERICSMALACGNIYVSPDLYFVNTWCSNAYQMAANYGLRDRILFGVATPGGNMKGFVDYWIQHLRDEVVEDVMYNNAARLFGLEEHHRQ